MKIIGIDPGTNSTGYCVIEKNGQRFKILDLGTIKNKSTISLNEKILNIYNNIKEIIDKHEPDAASVEDIFFGKNVQSLIKLGHIRGAILLVLAQNGLLIKEFSPREIKQSVTGYGNASKSQVEFMICKILNIQQDTYKHDTYDAAAIAYCALSRGI